MHRRAMKDSDLQETRTRPVLACLGVTSRFRLVRALAEADRCVGELAEAVGLSQSCTTRHLQALERVGLVKGRREGRRVRFRLRAEAPGLGALLGWVLLGPGQDAPAAGRGTSAIPPAPESPGPPAGSEATGRGAWPVEFPRPRKEAMQAPPAELEPAVAAGLDDRDSTSVAGPGRTRRPDELEDYLL